MSKPAGPARRTKATAAALCLAVIAALVVVAVPAIHRADASTLPAGFTDQLVASIAVPTALAQTPDGRILATEQYGRLWVIKNGVRLGKPALDLSTVTCSNSERGFLGVEVDPKFAVNHFIYIYYTYKKFKGCPTNNDKVPVNRLSRFVLLGSNVINKASEVVLIDGIVSYAGNHNGGDVHFGKDGYLYASVGDGGCDYAGDSGCGGQNDAARDKNILNGKIIRITRLGGIPKDNPYNVGLSVPCNTGPAPLKKLNCKETFARGLRNPFRFAFDPNASGARFYVNDTGQATWEEIDLGQAGADYGWNLREGHCATGSTTNCGPPPAGMTNPIFDYPHDASGCDAITAGAFVPNGSGWPSSFNGKYLYGDFTCGKIFRLDPQGSGFVGTPVFTDLGGAGPIHMAFLKYAGGVALYYTTYNGGGQVRRIVFGS